MTTSTSKRSATRRPPAGGRGARGAVSKKRAPAELDAITQIARILGSADPAQERYGRVAEAVRKVVSFDRLTVSKIDPGGRAATIIFRASGNGAVPQSDADTGKALDGTVTGGAVKIGMATLRGDGPSTIAAPLMAYGESAGAFTLDSPESERYSRDDLQFVERVAGLLAGSVATETLQQELEREGRERVALARIGQIVGSSVELDDVFEQFSDEVRKLLSADRITVSDIDAEAGTCTISCVSGTYIPGLEPGVEEPFDRSIAVDAVEQNRSVLFARKPGSKTAGAPAALAGEYAAGMQSVLVVPLTSRDRVIGALQISSTTRDAYSVGDGILAGKIGAQVAGAIANSQLYLESLQLAEERELRASLDAENRELLRVNEEKSKFTSLVSHELRSPLTSMLAFADLLARNKEGNLTERQLKMVHTLQRGGRTMNVLVDDLLNLSRIEAGTFKLERREFDAREALEEQLAGFVPILESKQQTLAMSLPEQPVWVDGDPDRFGQVVSNLVSNASKYSPEGRTVEVETRTEGDSFHVSVRDHGIGMNEEDQRQLFTAFFRASNEETRSEKGTGLGLCITKSLVEMHGGEMNVESEWGAGTTMGFYVRGLLDGPSEAEAEAEMSVEEVLRAHVA